MKVSVVSGKGGAGKTFVSLHLASLLQDRALLADLDAEEPDAHLYIDGEVIDTSPSYVLIPEIDESKCTNCNECAHVCQFHALIPIKKNLIVLDNLCHSCTACWVVCPEGAITPVKKQVGEITTFRKDQLTLIEGRMDVGQIAVVPIINQTKEMAEKVGKDKDYLIFDAPPGTSCAMVNSVNDSDLVIVVAEDTLFGLHDMQLVIDTLTHLNLPYLMVINKKRSDVSVVTKWAKEHDIPIIASIPFDKKISQVYGSGHLIFDDLPEYKETFTSIIKEMDNREKRMNV